MALVDAQGGKPEGPDMAKFLEVNLANVPPRVLTPAGKAMLPECKAELETFLRDLREQTENFSTL